MEVSENPVTEVDSSVLSSGPELGTTPSQPQDDNQQTKDSGNEKEEIYDAVIKVSPSDLELESSEEEEDPSVHFRFGKGDGTSDSDDEDKEGGESGREDDVKVFGQSGDEGQREGEEFNEIALKTLRKRTVKCVKKKRKKQVDSEGSVVKVPGKRGRKKDPRRLDGRDDTTTEDEDDEQVPVRFGTGYHLLFKRKVLKYASTHSNGATAEKFGLKPKLVREWRKMKDKIEADCKGPSKKRPRSDGYTVEEKLQAISFAEERSLDEARLLYNVDKRTIEKWKAKKDRLEARLLEGQGNAIREVGSGCKPKFSHIEESLRDWIVGLRLKGVTVNPKMILEKAKNLIEASSSEKGDGEKIKVPRSSTWVEGFLKRHNLLCLLGTTLGHEDPSEIITFQLINGKGDVTELANSIDEIPVNPNKRHRRRISLEDKLKIIQRIEGGETQMTVAKTLKVPTSTIQTIWSCRAEILKKSQKPTKTGKPKSICLLWRKYSVLASALQDWCEDQSLLPDKPLNASGLLDKAIQLSETYRLNGFFEDAIEWLKLFCKKRDLKDILGELSGSSSEALKTKLTFGNQSTSMQIADSFDNNDFQEGFNGFANDFVQSNNQTNIDSTTTDAKKYPFLHQPVPSVNYNSSSIPGLHQPLPTFQQELLNNCNTNTSGEINSQTNSNSNFTQSLVSSDQALNCITQLRNWVGSNFGHNEIQLNSYLAAIENAVLKKHSGRNLR